MFWKHAPLAAAALAFALFVLASSAFAAGVNDFIGVWNSPSASGGITQIFVEQDRFKLRIRVFGQCHPRDCDWGWSDATLYSPNPGGNPWQDASTLSARYDQGFSHRQIILRTDGRGDMGYEILTDFTDNSHRSPYVAVGRLMRQR
jgi:hypothetical protein